MKIEKKMPPLSARNLMQLAVFLLTAGLGVQFWVYVHQASGTGAITVSRPPGVEGFLPIGALMSWKRFLLTGRWDRIHPAAMVIFGFAVGVSFLLRKSFCGWFCPVGTFSEGCHRVSRYLFGKERHICRSVDVPLRAIKYILLAFFVFAVSAMSVNQIAVFARSPYYRLSDVKMLFFFTHMSPLTAGVLSVLLVLSLVFRNFWCRYLCPYGALLGLVAWISPTRIRRSGARCTHCGNCDRACPARLPVSAKALVRSPECTGCMDCVETCPVPGAIRFETQGIRPEFWRPAMVGIFIGVLFICMVLAASLTGHWQNHMSNQEFRSRIATIDSPGTSHPSFKF